MNYFQCEAVGEEEECLKDSLQELQSEIVMNAIGHISIILMPCMYFIFFINFSRLVSGQKCTKWLKHSNV